MEITEIKLLNANDVENRQVEVTLSNGTVIKIEKCYESWQQYGGTIEELGMTVDIAERYNNWLHGIEDIDDVTKLINLKKII